MDRSLLTPLLPFALLLGCAGDSGGEGWRSLDLASLDPAQKEQYSRALSARGAMFEALMSRVSAELAASGPAGTVGVCREAAPAIAERIAGEHGVRIGRTSWKLRNPGNAAPDWASQLLADRPSEDRAISGPDGQFGVTLPIHLHANCLVCHGQPEGLATGVREALAANYPDDQATGFSEGDLRGWFWVEVQAMGD